MVYELVGEMGKCSISIDPNGLLLGLRLLFSLHLYSWLMNTEVMRSGVLQTQGSVILSYRCN